VTGIGRGIAGPEVTQLVLPQSVRREIGREAARAAPNECCGLLIGRIEENRAVIRSALPSDNLAQNPVNGFEVDPALLLTTQRRLRGGPDTLLGHYHSHPRGPVGPSPTDRERAWVPGHVWLVIVPGKAGAESAFSANLAVEASGRIVLRRLGISAE